MSSSQSAPSTAASINADHHEVALADLSTLTKDCSVMRSTVSCAFFFCSSANSHSTAFKALPRCVERLAGNLAGFLARGPQPTPGPYRPVCSLLPQRILSRCCLTGAGASFLIRRLPFRPFRSIRFYLTDHPSRTLPPELARQWASDQWLFGTRLRYHGAVRLQ